MRVGFYHTCNIGFVQGGKVIVWLGITGRIDNNHFPGPDDRIGGMRQAFIIKLMDNHIRGKDICLLLDGAINTGQWFVIKTIGITGYQYKNN
jgi:hypothetical protein